MKRKLIENSSNSHETQAKMDEVLSELKQKLTELEDLKKSIEKKHPKKISAQKTKAMLEEIVVPPLELIKEPKKKSM